jgi:hypothetical protein
LRLRRLLLGSGGLGILLVLLSRLVMSDDAARSGAEGSVVAGNMASNAADHCPLDAAGLGGEWRKRNRRCNCDIPDKAHRHIPVIIDASCAVFVAKASGGPAGSEAAPTFFGGVSWRRARTASFRRSGAARLQRGEKGRCQNSQTVFASFFQKR